jgi:hypothetical protein
MWKLDVLLPRAFLLSFSYIFRNDHARGTHRVSYPAARQPYMLTKTSVPFPFIVTRWQQPTAHENWVGCCVFWISLESEASEQGFIRCLLSTCAEQQPSSLKRHVLWARLRGKVLCRFKVYKKPHVIRTWRSFQWYGKMQSKMEVSYFWKFQSEFIAVDPIWARCLKHFGIENVKSTLPSQIYIYVIFVVISLLVVTLLSYMTLLFLCLYLRCNHRFPVSHPWNNGLSSSQAGKRYMPLHPHR